MNWKKGPKFGILLVLFLNSINAFCPPGCTCSNETQNVVCDGVKVNSIPIFLNPSLKTLSLRSSQVRLDRDSIRIYKDLEYLDLSFNNIAEFPEEFFDELTNLRTLHLSGNQISTIGTTLFANLEKLENLDLSGNKIEKIEPNALDSLSTLLSLNLSANQLRFVEPDFNSLKHLTLLDISRNDVRTIASNSFQELSSLEYLNLAENSIGHLHPEMFSKQNKLTTLNLEGNRLEEIQRDTFNGLSTLNSLNLSRNMLKTIDVSNWQEVKKLDSLDLSRNPLFSLDSMPFRGLFSLRSLQLNSIDYLVEIRNNSFDGLYKLEELSLSGCSQLTRIHSAAFVENLALKRIDLSKNALETLDSNTLRWEMLEWLNLGENPWNCNCSLLAFMPGVLRRIRRSANRALCVKPEQMLGAELATAKSPQCSSAPDSTIFLLGAAVFLTALIILVLFIFCIRSMNCCCWRRNRKLGNNKNGRAPLYAPSSSFSDSLTYDKQHDPSATMIVTCQPSGRSITSSNSLNYSHFVPPFCYQQNDPNTDYYSSIALPPPHLEPCHRCSSSTNGYSTCPQGMNSATIDSYGQYRVEASPYAIGQSRLIRPPSFIAPPLPPSMPPPKLAYRHLEV